MKITFKAEQRSITQRTQRVRPGYLVRLLGWAAFAGATTFCEFAANAQTPAQEEALDFLSLGSQGLDYYQGSYSLGWRFTAKHDIKVTQLGFYDDKEEGADGKPQGRYLRCGDKAAACFRNRRPE